MKDRAPAIFISHASRDRKVAEALCKAIEARGVPCWIAVRDVAASQNYQDAIVEAIQGVKAMVLVFSQNANNSTEIKKEIALAGQQKLPVIPVRIEDVLPKAGLVYEFATRQWIDLFRGWDRAVDTIVAQTGQIHEIRPERRPRPWRPSRLLEASVMIGAILVLGIGSFLYLRPGRSPTDDPLSAYAEAPPVDPSTRVNDFKVAVRLGTTSVDRTWARSFKQWVETDDHGTKTSLTTIRRITLGDCPGSVLLGDEEKTKLVFIPDKGCAGMPLKISYEGGRSWGVAGNMTDVH